MKKYTCDIYVLYTQVFFLLSNIFNANSLVESMNQVSFGGVHTILK